MIRDHEVPGFGVLHELDHASCAQRRLTLDDHQLQATVAVNAPSGGLLVAATSRVGLTDRSSSRAESGTSPCCSGSRHRTR